MDDAFHRLLLKLKFVYCLVGLFLGLTCILVGAWLCLRGVTGHSSWAVSMLELSSTLNDASPGTVLFTVGVLVVWATRFKVRTERKYQVSKDEPGVKILSERVMAAEERPFVRPENQRGQPGARILSESVLASRIRPP
jgi:hypothetical protein